MDIQMQLSNFEVIFDVTVTSSSIDNDHTSYTFREVEIEYDFFVTHICGYDYDVEVTKEQSDLIVGKMTDYDLDQLEQEVIDVYFAD
jgi:hypothetical protein